LLSAIEWRFQKISKVEWLSQTVHSGFIVMSYHGDTAEFLNPAQDGFIKAEQW
jgi:hypothetical protein